MHDRSSCTRSLEDSLSMRKERRRKDASCSTSRGDNEKDDDDAESMFLLVLRVDLGRCRTGDDKDEEAAPHVVTRTNKWPRRGAILPPKSGSQSDEYKYPLSDKFTTVEDVTHTYMGPIIGDMPVIAHLVPWWTNPLAALAAAEAVALLLASISMLVDIFMTIFSSQR